MPKKLLFSLLLLLALVVAGVEVVRVLTPWMDRWGASDAEIAAAFPGDELLPRPAAIANRAVTIHAPPEKIFPWLLQLGAEKGGMYSYSWFETYLLNCRLDNADRIHPEWQDLKVGDLVKMCPGTSGPPPYETAQITPNRSLVLGHRENGKWVDLWLFTIIPQSTGVSRLVLRTRTNAVGGFWDVIHPGIFIMERGMLLGIQQRAGGLTP